MDNLMSIFTGKTIQDRNDKKEKKSKKKDVIKYKKVQVNELNEKVFDKKIKLNESKGKRIKKPKKQQEDINQQDKQHQQQGQQQDIMYGNDKQLSEQEIEFSKEEFRQSFTNSVKNRYQVIRMINETDDKINSEQDNTIKKELIQQKTKLIDDLKEQALQHVSTMLKLKLDKDQQYRSKIGSKQNFHSSEIYRQIYREAIESQSDIIQGIVVDDWVKKKTFKQVKDKIIDKLIQHIQQNIDMSNDDKDKQISKLKRDINKDYNQLLKDLKEQTKDIDKKSILGLQREQMNLGENKLEDISMNLKPQSQLDRLKSNSYDRLQRLKQQSVQRDKYSQQDNKNESFQSLSPQHQQQDDVRPITVFQTAFENNAQRDTYKAKQEFIKPIDLDKIEIKPKEESKQQYTFESPQQSIIKRQQQSPFSDIDIPSKIKELKQISTQTSALKNQIDQKNDKLVIEEYKSEDKQNKTRIEKLQKQLDEQKQQYNELFQQKISQQKEMDNISDQLVQQKKINEEQSQQLNNNIDKLQIIIQNKEELIQNQKQDNNEHVQSLKEEKQYLQYQLETYQYQVGQLQQERNQLNQQISNIQQYYQQNVYQQKINIVNYNPGQQDQQQFIQQEQQQIEYPQQQQIEYPQLQVQNEQNSDDYLIDNDFKEQQEEYKQDVSQSQQSVQYTENDTIKKFSDYLKSKGIDINITGQGRQKIKNRLKDIRENKIIQTDNLNIDFYLILDMYHNSNNSSEEEQLLQLLSNVIQRKYKPEQYSDILSDFLKLDHNKNKQLVKMLGDTGYFKNQNILEQIDNEANNLEQQRQRNRQITGQNIVQRRRNQ